MIYMPRKFDGKRYLKAGGGFTKKEARGEADKIRKRGGLARVVPAPKSMRRKKTKYNWLVYSRRK